MTDTTSWDRLVALVTDDPRVAPLVRSAVRDPASYLEQHSGAMADRGIDDPDEVEGVYALVDALEAIGEVAYVDWREDPDEVRAQLQGLPRVRATGIVLDVVGQGDQAVEQAVTAANRLLAPVGVAVVGINEGSDSYALVAVPADRVPAVLAAGAAVGGLVDRIG